MRIRYTTPLLFVAVGLVLLPGSVQAQGLLTGQIDDVAGAGLPGVIVDAIWVSNWDERTVKQVTVIADENGHYKLDLSPGVYSVRFSLPGFETVFHESIGIEDDCPVSLDVRLWLTELRAGVAVAGFHSDAAPSSMAERRPLARWDRQEGSASTPLVERDPRRDQSRNSIERQLFFKHVEDACLGYVPMWLSHLDLVSKQRPCQVAWVQPAWGGRLS